MKTIKAITLVAASGLLALAVSAADQPSRIEVQKKKPAESIHKFDKDVRPVQKYQIQKDKFDVGVVKKILRGKKNLPVGIAIASGSTEHDETHAWFDDGTYSVGRTANFEFFSKGLPRMYKLPEGKFPTDIIAISMSHKELVTAWYRDQTFSMGFPNDLGMRMGPTPFKLPGKMKVSDIVGIAEINSVIYTFYKNNTVSKGSKMNLGKDWHRGFYPSKGRKADEIVDVAISKKSHVYAWYKSGQVSSGSSSRLDSRRALYGYKPSYVIYNDLSSKEFSTNVLPTGSNCFQNKDRFVSPQSGHDAMVAVGEKFLITADAWNFSVIDRNSGCELAKTSTYNFFNSFFKTKPDGTYDENSINSYLSLNKPCSKYNTTRGDSFCLDELYDTRVRYDKNSKRFYINANTRHPVWNATYDDQNKHEWVDGNGDAYALPKNLCMRYSLNPSQTSNCIHLKKEGSGATSCRVFVSDKALCDSVPHRSIAVAVSKTEDPRDGFHQYMVTHNRYRDWPWMEIVDDKVVVGSLGKGSYASSKNHPLLTIFDKNDINSGRRHPKYFIIRPKDNVMSQLNSGLKYNVENMVPIMHLGNTNGYIFAQSGSTNIVAIKQKPIHEYYSKTPELSGMRAGYVAEGLLPAYRNQFIYFATADNNRTRINVLRAPVLFGYKGIATDSSRYKQFLYDLPDGAASTQTPALAVNKDGVIFAPYVAKHKVTLKSSSMFGKTTQSSAIYVAKAGSNFEDHGYLHLGEGDVANGEFDDYDYMTAVVDPVNNKDVWVASPYLNSKNQKRAYIYRVKASQWDKLW